MINNPFQIVCVLLLIEALVLFLAGHPNTKKYFEFIPSVFWIYFLPMLAATLGILDSQNPVYGMISTYLLPASLLLLLLPVDMKAIMRLGKPALFMMFAGSTGIMLGTVASFALFRFIVGQEFWAGFGALSASWTGGSANMIAVKEAIAVPDKVFLPMVVVDTVVPYLWMGMLVAFVAFQPRFDRRVKADGRIMADLRGRINASPEGPAARIRFIPAFGLVMFALAGGSAAITLAGRFPEVKDIFSTYAWTIIIVSILGIALSFSPARRLEQAGATKVGYILLYFVLTSIGAKASIADAGSAVILILAGFVIVGIHAAVLLLAARLIKAPMFLVAAASQANIGGVASAPVVAEIYQPGFASVGLLLAILGNILGTYIGIFTAQLCRMLS